MTRRLLWGLIVLLLVTNLTTIAVWTFDRSDDSDSDGSFSVNLNKKEPVASVAGEDISYDKWTNKLEERYGKQVLKDMVDRELVLNLAEEHDLELNDKLIERELSLLLTMGGILTKEQIEKNRETWEEDVRYRLFLEELLTRGISVGDNQIEEYYNNYKDQYEFIESIQLSHILVDDRQTAERIVTELEDGASFNSLAKEYSVDEDSRNDGGYLGYFTSSSSFLSADYYDKAMDMSEHTYSDPFLTGNGVAIIYLHQLLPSISFSYDELKNHIRREIALEEIKTTISADPLWNELDVDWVYE
ncbi:protein secretion protein [Aquibacillus halophilus]|uniref:peptidylprolyl isomerase n=1 Tax=Aquibacillus halophilus TaxID=930132 RepID=A0A6A8DUU0_9BACI|nr:peptidylprolyl isomerase [Aquibacillus halophilus]MRH44962.1 protein secretion protein [Aquibacillus halophilus]